MLKRDEELISKLLLAVEQSPGPVMITDLQANIEFVNAAFVTITGYTRAEVVGKNARLLQSGHTPKEIYQEMWATLLRGEIWKGELHNRRKDGSEYLESTIFAPVRQSNGLISHYLAIKEDITERKRIEQELLQHQQHLEEMVVLRTQEAVKAKELAEQANLAKSLFLANMSHELRTPLHAMLAFARLGLEKLADDGTPLPKIRTYLNYIQQSGERLLMLLNDLLDLSKLDAGKHSLNLATPTLESLVKTAVQDLEILAKEKAIEIQYQINPPNLQCECDAEKIGQVLSNLLANAIKLSPASSTIDIDVCETELAVLMKVRDQGPGIPVNELDEIFNQFVQSSITRTGSGGTGLGLAICREIVKLHAGTIHAENNPQGGATIVILLPLMQTAMDKTRL